MNYKEESLKKHYEWKGKIEVNARAKVDNKEALALAYTPGVAEPCLEIQKDYKKSWELTRRWNMVAVRRNCCTWSWRHRARSWNASYGRKKCTL